MRGDREKATLPQQSAPAWVGERHAPEAATVYVWYAIVLRESFGDERIVCSQQFDHAPILAQQTFEEQLRLLLKVASEILAEIRKHRRIGRDRWQVAQVQPLPGKIARQR